MTYTNRYITFGAIIILIAIIVVLGTLIHHSQPDDNSANLSDESSIIDVSDTVDIDISLEDEISIADESEVEMIPSVFSYVFYDGNLEPLLKQEKQFCVSEVEIREQIIAYSKQFNYFDEKNIYFQMLEQDIMSYTQYIYLYEQQLQSIYSAWETMPEPTDIKTTKDFIWAYLRNQGFNEYVSAGIMANIQAECAFQWNIYSPHYESYGICQWLLQFNDIANATLTEQLIFLTETMPKQFNNPGFNQSYKNMDYNTFLALQDEKEAAAAFMLIYERPANINPAMRQDYATEIYKEFVD